MKSLVHIPEPHVCWHSEHLEKAKRRHYPQKIKSSFFDINWFLRFVHLFFSLIQVNIYAFSPVLSSIPSFDKNFELLLENIDQFLLFLCLLSPWSAEGEQLRSRAAFPDGLWHQRAKNHPAVSGSHPETHVPRGGVWGDETHATSPFCLKKKHNFDWDEFLCSHAVI